MVGLQLLPAFPVVSFLTWIGVSPLLIVLALGNTYICEAAANKAFHRTDLSLFKLIIISL